MSVMANGFSNLSTEIQSRTVKTSVGTSTSAGDHAADLHNEIHQVSRTMSNPAFRATYEAGFEEALSKLASFIQHQDRAQILSGSDIQLSTQKKKDPRGDDEEKRLGGIADPKKITEETQMSITRTIIGSFQVHSRKSRLEQPDWKTSAEYEYQTSLRYHPAPWLLRWGIISSGLSLITSSSTQGWKNVIRTFRAVPDSAPIFEFCKTGNLAAARTLLASGQASVLDTNSLGWTPLHVSQSSTRPTIQYSSRQGLTLGSLRPTHAILKPVVSSSMQELTPMHLPTTFPWVTMRYGNYQSWGKTISLEQ